DFSFDILYSLLFSFFFFFQAEDGIRDKLVTGVQTCALPICAAGRATPRGSLPDELHRPRPVPPRLQRVQQLMVRLRRQSLATPKIGRASCRERVYISGGAG